MTAQEIGAILESDSVGACLGLASTWGSFHRLVKEHLIFAGLRIELQAKDAVVTQLCNYACELWQRPIDPFDATLHDMPLAAALCLLRPYAQPACYPTTAIRDLAWRIQDQASPNFFWARAAALAAIVLPGEKQIEAWPQADQPAATLGDCLVCGKPVFLADACAFFSDAITHRGPCADRFSGELHSFIAQVGRQFAEARGEQR